MANLTCPICNQSAHSYRLFCALTCGHILCNDCQNYRMQRRHNNCITCNQRINSRDIIQLQPSFIYDSDTPDFTSNHVIDFTGDADNDLLEEKTKEVLEAMLVLNEILKQHDNLASKVETIENMKNHAPLRIKEELKPLTKRKNRLLRKLKTEEEEQKVIKDSLKEFE